MNIFKNLFKKEQKQELTETDAPAIEQTYTIGWEIYNKDGTILKRVYDNVSKQERDSIAKIIEDETNQMHATLNEAYTNDVEFVNLQGNVIRLSDVVRVCTVNTTSAKKT